MGFRSSDYSAEASQSAGSREEPVAGHEGECGGVLSTVGVSVIDLHVCLVVCLWQEFAERTQSQLDQWLGLRIKGDSSAVDSLLTLIKVSPYPSGF